MSDLKSTAAPSFEAANVAELMAVTKRLLDAVVAGDWNTYRELVAADITCFEPEARGQLVEGLAFHEFYFKLPTDSVQPKKPVTTTLASPVVRMLSDTIGLVVYVRLTQTIDGTGQPITRSCEETRLWKKQGSHWQHVHFHRSAPTTL